MSQGKLKRYFQTKARLFLRRGWKTRRDHWTPEHVILTHPGQFARGCTEDEAVEIKLGHHYNGGGPDAFGGAEQWPVLEVTVNLPEGTEGHAYLLAGLFAHAYEKFIAEYSSTMPEAEK
jgi:hypothetical protein